MGRGTSTGVTGEDIARAYDARGPGETFKDVAARLGINPNTARRKKSQYDRAREGGQRPAGGERVRFEERGDQAEATSESKRVKTLAQLLAACQVDTRVWEVDRHVVNTWEVGVNVDGRVQVETLFQVKAYLKRRQTAEWDQVLEGLLERVRHAGPRVRAPKYRLMTDKHLMLPGIFDLHMNKRSVDGLYTVARAAADFRAVVDATCARVQALGIGVDRVLFPAGNDALHADNLQGDTTDGTRLELAADQRDAIDALVDAYIYAVDRFAEIAPVKVVVVESNHDRLASYWLGKALEAWFHRDERVTVDARRAPRKYHLYGATLLGLEHGDKVRPRDLAALMAQEAPQEWAASRYREWLRGHIHHSAGMYYPIASDSGVTVRVIPALCPPDQYHLLRGYLGGQRAAEVMYYHQQHGPYATFPVFVDEVVPAHGVDKHASPPQHAGESPDGAGGQP